MDSSSHMASLPEDIITDEHLQQQTQPASASAFASVPQRPPTKSSSEKYAPLDWSVYFDKEDDVAIPESNDELRVPLYSVYTVVVILASKIKEKARVVAMDLRGHGKSLTEDDLDLSVETMCNDVLAVIKELYSDSPPAIILVGHRRDCANVLISLYVIGELQFNASIFCITVSMGGSIAVHVAARRSLSALAGLVVVDVVEGTAMASLIHMQKILSSRMQHFSSIEKAIEWSVRGGSLRNIDSARVSIPATLKYDHSKKCYLYRTELEKTEQYWKGWYEGLSDKFLSCPVPKLLLLAGTDRLDRSLTIGQMQGKFQMVVVRHTGHAIQEDVPDEFATLIVNFISRNRIGPHGIEIPGLRKPAFSKP
ncbi:hypothetical protein JHK85_030386 [Glycine max]|nr:hypothetical protein JHK85_030386 [Glycine max]KAG4993028.1 hypothetical protein JHK86_029855 [Glycine max]